MQNCLILILFSSLFAAIQSDNVCFTEDEYENEVTNWESDFRYGMQGKCLFLTNFFCKKFCFYVPACVASKRCENLENQWNISANRRKRSLVSHKMVKRDAGNICMPRDVWDDIFNTQNANKKKIFQSCETFNLNFCQNLCKAYPQSCRPSDCSDIMSFLQITKGLK